MITFWDVVERTSHGERMSESDFDTMLWENVRALTEKYDIHFDGETAVPSDDGLADRAYQAALELFVAIGFYCTNTQRAVRFTREEVEEAVRHAKTSYVVRRGARPAHHGAAGGRGRRPPTCIFSGLGVPVEEDLFPKVCLAMRRSRMADAFCCVSLHDTFRGIPVKSGHPGRDRGVHVGHHQAPRGSATGGAAGAGPVRACVRAARARPRSSPRRTRPSGRCRETSRRSAPSPSSRSTTSA